MKIYARTSHVPKLNRETFSPHKLYPVETETRLGFWTISDSGHKCFCLWEGCSFLAGDAWERVEVEDE